MKRMLKKSLALILALTMVFAVAPLSGIVNFDWKDMFTLKASAIEKSDLPADFDLDNYSWEIIKEQQKEDNRYNTQEDYNNLAYYMYFVFSAENTYGSIARIMYNCFAENKDYAVSAEAWEAVKNVANPGNTLDDLNLQQQYESILYALLFDSIGGSKAEEISYSTALSDATGFMDFLLSTSQTAEIIDKTDLDSTASKELRDAALAFISDGKESKWDTLADFNGMVDEIAGTVDKLYSSATDILNYTQKVGMYCSLMDIGADTVRVLLDMKNNTDNLILKLAIQAVVDTVSKDWYGVVEKTVLDVGSYVTSKALEELVSYAYEGCCAMVPFLQGMVVGDKVGTAVCNLLFATEDNLKQYETLKIIVQIEDALTSTFNSYIKNVSAVGASSVWKSIDLGAILYETGKDAAVEMAYICETKGIVNIISNAFGGNGKNSVTQYENSANRINNSVQDYYKNLRSCWKKYIETDYPQFSTTLTNIETGVIPITSITISEKQVYYSIGDYPTLPKITVNPSNATMKLGYKSDNEEIFRSDEYYPVSQFEECKTTGTANITVYSIDDPSIYDTFTITVVDEDETAPETGIIDSGTCGKNLTWKLTESGRLVISGSGGMTSWSSSSRAPWDDIRENIKTVIISDGVTSIGDYAFYYCTSLTSITIPDSVTSIGGEAFEYCISLTSITIPDSVTSIGGGAFEYCTSLASITVDESNPNYSSDEYGVLFNKDKTEFIQYPVGNVRTEYIIPDSVTSIGYSAFEDCTSLTNITIPDSVTSIGASAFSDTGIYNDESNWEKDVLYIGNHLIEAKTTVAGDYTIKSGTKTIADGAFQYCTSLTSVTIPNSVTSIGEYVFYMCSGLISVTIPDSVTSIGWGAFYWCKSLTSVTIPDSVTSIDDWSFGDCTSLTSVTIPNSVTSIGGHAFYHCTSLTSVAIPNSVTSIGDYAFSYCYSLESITIPDSVTSIGSYAFYYCNNLSTIYYFGSFEEWKAISISDGNNNLKNATILFAKENGEVKKDTVSDEKTNVSVEYISNFYEGEVGIVVEQIFDGTAFQVIDTQLDVSKNEIYDIKMTIDGVETQPNGKVKVKIPIPAGYDSSKTFVYHVNTNTGTVENMNAVVEDGFLVLETDHFSYYAVVEINDNAEDPGTVSIKTPSTTTINYGDSIILHSELDGELPAGARIEWTADNGNFGMSISSDGSTCKISPKSNGKTVFTVTVYDKDGNVISSDTQEMTAKAGIWQKIVAFFKKIFGMTKTFPEMFKNII